MRTYRGWTCALATIVSLVAVPLSAQRGVVRGVVFDSLRGRPLANAFVTVTGAQKSITTDNRGHFTFESLGPGRHTFIAQHPLLDSIGLSGLTARVTVDRVEREIRLATPSFGTMWAAACQGRPPKDSGIVFGTVRDAVRGTPAAGATVELTWIELILGRRRTVTQRRSRMVTETNAEGGYAACGVPMDIPISVFASLHSSETATLDLPGLGNRVQRRDLLVGPADSSERGSIEGIVTTPSGVAWSGARVVTSGLEAVVTDGEGRFRLTGVPVGTRQIAVYAVGASPTFVPVDVVPNANASIVIYVEKIPTLAGMTTTEAAVARMAAMEFTERKRLGLGFIRDSTDLIKFDEFVNVLREARGLNVRFTGTAVSVTVSDGTGGSCVPEVLIDGAQAGVPHLIDLQPREVAGIEVYARPTQIPIRYQRGGIRPQCGMILVWTKYGFRNR